MRRIHFVSVTAVALLALLVGAGSIARGAKPPEQHVVQPLPASCVEAYFPQPSHGTLLLTRNVCSQTIYLTLIPHNHIGEGNAGGGSSTLGPGRQSEWGIDRGTYQRAGGYTPYVCPSDATPVHPDGSKFTQNDLDGGPAMNYSCKTLY